MANQGSRFLLIYLLVLAILGAGILCTYQAMVKTTGRTAPALLSLESIGEQWNLEVLGVQYNVKKKDIAPAHLKEEAILLVQQVETWARPILKDGLEQLRAASDLVLERLTGE